MRKFVVAVTLLAHSFAFGAANRQLDAVTITTGNPANVLTLPSGITDTLLSATSSATVTNKSISGATNTLSNIPVSAIATGTGLGVNAGGTGLTTITTNGVVYGNGTSAVGVTAAGTQFQVLTAGATGIPSFTALSLNQSAAVTGQLGVANGGTGLASGTSGGILGFTASGTLASSGLLTANALILGGGAGATPTALGSLGTTTTVLHGNAAGAPTFGAVSLTADVSGTLPVGNGGTGVANPTAGSVLVGNGSSAVSLVAAGTSGNVLTSNGTTWTSVAPASTSPNVVGSTASPTAITAVGGVSFSGTNYNNINFIQGSGGAVTVTANPQITAATNVGQVLTLIGRSATNTVTLADGNGLSLNGTWVGALQSVIELVWDGTVWVERSRR